MRTVVFLAALVALPLAFYFTMSMLAALGRVVRGGTGEARHFAIAGIDLGMFVRGSAKGLDSSLRIPTRAGIWIETKDDGSFEVRSTRTVSRDVY